MQVVFHTGAHCTDEDRLLKCLLSNREAFSKQGISIPGPGKYRKLFKKTFAALQDGSPDPAARDVLLEEILDGESADRLVLSNTNFFGSEFSAVDEGMLYPRAAARMEQLRDVFRYDQMEMFLAIRNPASFVPAVLAKASGERVTEVMASTDMSVLRWSDMIERIRAAVPDLPLTVWCNEDTPLIWAQLIRDLAGLEHGSKIVGGFSLLSEIMSAEGMKRFRSYLHAHPELTEMQKRRVIAAFLDKYALEDEVEEELDLPGWTEEMVDELTDLYDEDVFAIQRIPGVQFIAP